MDSESCGQSSKWYKIKLKFNIIVFVLSILISGYYFCFTFINYHYLFTWHIVFGAISYILIMPISVMFFDEVWFQKYTRKQKSKIHGIVISIATFIAILSVAVEFYRKEIYIPQYPSITHFTSAHAITGLISLILYILTDISGLVAHNNTWFREKVISVRPVVLKLCHNVMGQISYQLGMISIIIVTFTPWFIRYNNLAMAIILTILTSLVTIWSLLNSYLNTYRQIEILR